MVKQEDTKDKVVLVKDEPEDDVIILDNDSDTDSSSPGTPKRETSPEVEIVSMSLKPEPDDEVIILDSPKRPVKKQRLTMEIILPTMAQLIAQRKKQAAKVEENTIKGMKLMKGKKIKKFENMQFSLDTVNDRLKLVNAVVPYEVLLDKGIQEFTVSRDFMSSVYGGSMQATCPKISDTRFRAHGYNMFTYLHEEYHPHAPRFAGGPGLFLCTAGGEDWGGLQRVFTRILSNRWQYMGQYEIKSAKSLTPEEWRQQDQKVRQTWGNEICRQRWGSSVCARILGRRELGRNPTNKEMDEIYESGRYKRITPQEVLAAYDSGEERLGVWTMKCVDYDTEFQLELYERFPAWVPAPRKPRKKKGDTEGESKGKKSVKKEKTKAAAGLTAVSKKRKRDELSDSESDLTELESEDEPEHRVEEGEMEDGEPLEELLYKSKGTRSRPICL
ncbi:hypothetical protein NLJ89_g2990 [Agrocybe chaxingu]|uniref:DUF6697 domain-containing protein n=1 Tax=Agrocybe chaxingu TaxID=84603 RepID=A0A9W8K3D0_9AGAR|nr:hypothetical protein NLJ89_g2990 [Agrocybe chaxingu]